MRLAAPRRLQRLPHIGDAVVVQHVGGDEQALGRQVLQPGRLWSLGAGWQALAGSCSQNGVQSY